GAELSHQVNTISDAGVTDRMAIDLSHANADASLYARDAFGAAQEHGLNYVEMVNSDGILISSVQNPSRVGQRVDWVTSVKNWNDTDAFLKKEELPDGVALSLTVVRTIEWSNDPVDAETFHAIPLTGRNNELLGIFFVGSARRELVQLTREILKSAGAVAAAALLVGLIVSFWISARITRPVEKLA